MKRKQRRVLLVLGWSDYRLQRGVERYAQQRRWHLSPEVTRERVIPWGWNGDGILAWLAAGDDLAEFVVRAAKPTVDFSFRRPHLKFPRVLYDHARSAQIVAEHFLSRNFTSFIYYEDYDNWSFEERGRAFVEALEQTGHACNWLRWRQPADLTVAARYQEWKRKRKWLASQLRSAPKPVAVFAPSDWMAVDILETCESTGLSVPEQVAIVGADNLLLAADLMRTPITTVDPNLEAIGYRGAELLDDLMDGKPAPTEPIRVPPLGLIVRKSSDLMAVNHPAIARSLRYLHNHFHEPIGVGHLAKVAAMSLRGFHQTFVQQVGRSPGHELHRVRIDRAKQLLTTSAEKTQLVAASCGYQNVNSFWVAFRKATGLTPQQYRQRFGQRSS
ncbi:MAG TPA: DNA-binding transcriptional regulator [Verrucomicrobiae bacterium]|nr:DNA-binding transcriptional regulator [Verrucomicrobiae bacterium]